MARLHRLPLIHQELKDIQGAIDRVAESRQVGQEVETLKNRVGTVEGKVDNALPHAISDLGSRLQCEIDNKAAKADVENVRTGLNNLKERVDELDARGCRYLARNFFDHLHIILQVGMMSLAGETAATWRNVPDEVLNRIKALKAKGHPDYIALQERLKGTPAGPALDEFVSSPAKQDDRSWKALASRLNDLWEKVADACRSEPGPGPIG